MPARKPAVRKTAAGIIVPTIEPTKPNPAYVYAKAVVAFIVTEIGTMSAWGLTLPAHGPISRAEWFALAAALVTPFGASAGVALATNAKPADGEAGHVNLPTVLIIAGIWTVAAILYFGWHH